MFDQDSLWNYIYLALEKEWPDAHKSKIEGATERVCEEVAEWVPKKGDFWLTDEGVLHVNQGWKVVTEDGHEF